MHLAAEAGYTKIVKTLLGDIRINVNTQDKSGMTPLHYAARNGQTKSIIALLNHPAIDVNIMDQRGRRPIFYAKNHLESYQALMAFPGIEAPDEDEISPI